MSGYEENHTRDTYKLYNLETNRVNMIKCIKWVEWKVTSLAETMNMFCTMNKQDLIPGIE